MSHQANNCKICGAKCPVDDTTSFQHCAFCGFTHKPLIQKMNDNPVTLPMTVAPAAPNIKKISHEISKRSSCQCFHIEGLSPHYFNDFKADIIPYDTGSREIDILFSEMILPFMPDVNGYFKERYRSLAKGGLLYLTTPVRRLYLNPPPLTGQVNFFKSKNIMFLLEQHGFRMAWRQNRFSPQLRIIARRC